MVAKDDTNKYAAYFEANPKADELYVSSDDQVFTHEGWCKSHVKFLEDKTITIVPRPEEAEEATEETEGTDQNPAQ